MKNLIIFVLLFAVLVGAGTFYFSKKQNKAVVPVQDTTAVTPTVRVDDELAPVEESPEVTALRAGGSSYADPQGVFSILYPNDYTVDQPSADNPYVRFSKRGEQQRPQSEMSNGVLVVIETIDLEGKTLEEYVDARISAESANSEVLKPKTTTSFKEYPGFTYEMRGLGSSTYLVLQKNAQSTHAISISYLVADPQESGYQAQVNAILSTLELLK
jgi:hypothetical protein